MSVLRFIIRSFYVVIPAGIVFTMLVSAGMGHHDEIDRYFAQFKPQADAQESASKFVQYAYPVTAKNLIRYADCIIRARVLELLPTTKDRFGAPQHDVRLSVATVYKGDERIVAGDVLTVRVDFSGFIDGVLYWSLGDPVYRVGEDVIAYLGEYDGVYTTMFDGYGLVHVADDEMVTGATWDFGVFELPLPVYEQRLRRLLRN